MKWKIYTKMVETEDGGLGTRWFWRKPVLEGRAESPGGFTSQEACEADAARHGYTPENGDVLPPRTFGL